MKSVGAFLLSLSVLTFCFPLLAEGVEVHATVNRNQVGMGDVINLTVSVSAQNSVQVEEPQLPRLDGFELINSSSSMETRSTFTNGKFQTSQARNFSYMLAVTKKGVLTIPSIAVQVEGKTLNTETIKISATNARAAPHNSRGQEPDSMDEMDSMEEIFNQMLQRRLQPNIPGMPRGGGQAQPPANPDEAFFISAEVDKSKAFVGEQITASFYIYTRGNIRDIDTLKYPDLKGFWKEEIEMATRLNFEQAVVNGVPYQRALLVSYALFPLRAGKSLIDTYKAKCTVITPSSFGFGRPYEFTKASRPITIDVSDVPVADRPANFSGAVGHFRATAHFEPPSGTVNQPVTLRVRVEGQGNAKLIELPKLDLPPSFELYDQKSDAKFARDGSSYKEFEVMIIPREPGIFNIPAVALAVFDPQSQKYTEATAQALNITITGSATTPAAPTLPVANGASDDKGGKGKLEAVLPGLATELDSATLSVPVLVGLTALLYVAVLTLLGFQAWRRLRHKPKRVSLNLVLKRRLGIMRELAIKGEWRRVGVELTNGIYYVLGQISEQGGAHQELSRLLEHTPPSLRNELSAPIQKLVERCEALTFAPEKMIGDMNEPQKLEALIKEFETVMTRAIELAEI